MSINYHHLFVHDKDYFLHNWYLIMQMENLKSNPHPPDSKLHYVFWSIIPDHLVSVHKFLVTGYKIYPACQLCLFVCGGGGGICVFFCVCLFVYVFASLSFVLWEGGLCHFLGIIVERH